MIILDTNVVSALMRAATEPAVVAWLDRQLAQSVWTTTVTIMEVQTGIELLPAGRRRRLLEEAFKATLREDLADRVLSFDRDAAERAGSIAARRQLDGRTIEVRDAQIAGLALARGATLATGNIRHFRDTGIDLVDPWHA